MAKLPRRTMSMARRAVKTAEAAADADVVEGIIGAPHAGKPSIFEGVVAWLAFIAGVLILMFAATLVCKVAETGDSDFSPTGALPHDAPRDAEAFYREGDPTDGRMGAGRESPFPGARQEDPVILEVACPQGTVHVSTGPGAADSLCIVGQLAGAGGAPLFAPTAQAPTPPAPTPGPSPTVQLPRAPPGTGQGTGQSTIGATLVPFGLHCEEDELIGFTPVDPVPPGGYPLGCVHIDTLRGEQ